MTAQLHAKFDDLRPQLFILAGRYMFFTTGKVIVILRADLLVDQVLSLSADFGIALHYHMQSCQTCTACSQQNHNRVSPRGIDRDDINQR
jgi:hypothetical protein